MSSLHPRGAGHRGKRVLVAAAVIAGSTAFAGTAAADSGSISIQWLNAPPIEVASVDSEYTEVVGSPAPITGTLIVKLDAGISGRVKGFKAWPILSMVEGVWENIAGHSHSESYGLPRPKTVMTGVGFNIPKADYADLMVRACNFHADRLRQQGLSDSQIFGQDRTYKIGVWGGLEYEMSGLPAIIPDPGEVRSWNSYPQVTLTCQRVPSWEPLPAANDLMLETPAVEQATLAILEEHSLHGACAINLSGVIRTSKPNTRVKFRYRNDEGWESDLKMVVTDQSATAMFNHEHPLPEGGTTSGKFRMVGAGPGFLSAWADYEVDCGSPAQGLASNGLPPELTLAVTAKEKKLYQGFICPARVMIDGRILAEHAMEARAIFVSEQHQSLPEAQSQVNEQNFSVVAGQHLAVGFEPEMRWSNVPVSGGNPPRQWMKFSFKVVRTHGVIAETEKTVVLSCRKPQTSGVAQGAVGGISPGKPAPTYSQQAAVGQLALPQALAIQAPKGLVHKGEIRLAGGTASGSYTLKFFRKDGGAYTAVNATQLPKQMTGMTASFPLKALTGGRDWRLEVCPEKQGGAGGQPAACKTTDFRLPRIGGAGAAVKAPGQLAGTKVFIVPGAVQ